MLSLSKSLKLIPATLTMVLMTTGCQEDLTNVEKFGTTSVLLKETSTKIIQDIYDSCTRKEFVQIQSRMIAPSNAPPENRVNFNEINSPNTLTSPNSPNLNLPNPIPSNSIPISPATSEASKYEFPPIKIRVKCQPKKNQSQVLQEMNIILVNYVETLGRLASRNTVTFDSNLKTISESLQGFSADNLKLVKEEDQASFNKSITNGTNIANALLNLIADQQRQEKLKPIIICSNNAVTNYVGELQKLIKLFYLDGVLKEEEEANYQYIEEMYSNYLDPTSNNSAEVYAALENDYKQRIQVIDTRQVVAEAYINILEQTARTHQALAKTFTGDMTAPSQQALCQSEGYGQSNDSSTTNTRKLTPQQLEKASQILHDYDSSIQLSLKTLEENF